jgi:hypothetical protein
LAATSREIVDADRPSPRPIAHIESRAANPSEISSRSAIDSRDGDRSRSCTRAALSNRCTVLELHRTARAASSTDTPDETNPLTINRSSRLNLSFLA